MFYCTRLCYRTHAANAEAVDTAADLPLFKAIGLYQLLNDDSNGWYRTVFLALLRVAFTLQAVQVVGLYYVLHDFERFANMVVLVISGFMCLAKGYVLVTNVDRAQTTLHTARYAFTSCGRRDQDPLRRCGLALSRMLRTFTVISYTTLFIWILAPYFMDGHVLITDADNTVHQYRMTINNLWIPVSASVFNRPPVWTLVYLVEGFMITINVFSWTLFDCYLITMCFVLNTQLYTLTIAYEQIGHQSLRRSLTPPLTSGL